MKFAHNRMHTEQMRQHSHIIDFPKTVRKITNILTPFCQSLLCIFNRIVNKQERVFNEQIETGEHPAMQGA